MNKEENTVSLPTDASIDCIRKMYWEDKKYEQPIVSYNHQTKLDVLDRICYGRNQRILMENTMEKQRIFRQLKRLVCSRGNNFVCRKIDISFNINCGGWINTKKRNFLYSMQPVITNLSENIYQPIALQNIAAAGSVKNLNCYGSRELLFVFNIVKRKEIIIRAGPDHERKLYNFAAIIKHFLYRKEFEPIATKQYFEDVTMNPSVFCIHCGIFKKIEKSMCWCSLCNFLRNVGVFTTKIEKPYHATPK